MKLNRPKGDITKESIIDSATKLFINNGFFATTTRQITDDLKMTRGIIYNYFDSKDEIFVAVLYKNHPWLQIVKSVKGAKGDNLEELVNSARKILVDKWDKNPEYIKLHFIELVEFQGEHLPNLFSWVFNEMVEVLSKKNQVKGELSVHTLSSALLGLFFAYLMSEKFSGLSSKNNLIEDVNGIDFDYFSNIYLKGLSE